MQPTVDFNPSGLAKSLLRRSRQGALATLFPDSGDPYCSLVNLATHSDGSPILLISRLAVHTRNILADNRVSLMLDERAEGDPLEGARIMLLGRAEEASEADLGHLRHRYLNAHPSAEAFVGFKDFSFFLVRLSGTHLVAGFGRIVDLKPPQFLTEIGDESADWRCTGCDPDGIDLQAGRTTLRLEFPERVTTSRELRTMLVRLAETARAKG